jgi:hypothetical protein
VVSVRGVLNQISALGQRSHPVSEEKYGEFHELFLRIGKSGLFDPNVYLSQHEDVRNAGEDPWLHFLRYGLSEGRHFTSPEVVARSLARVQPEFVAARADFIKIAACAQQETADAGAKLRDKNVKIGVYCSTVGNFYMQEIADLLHIGLQDYGLDALLRSEQSNKDEQLDIRVFVAPHEFFHLGQGTSWRECASHSNTVLYNVEQAQTSWFCRALSFLFKAPLVLDISLQTAQILRQAGCNTVFFAPGFVERTPYTTSQLDVSHVDLVRGYQFAKESYDWRDRDALSDRPIDVLFVGARTPHRDQALIRLENISGMCRFVCAYREATKPFTRTEANGAAAEMNWALSQRAKIVLNLHRDWLGYFEWSRMALRGFWQGACVVTDPCLPNPVFAAGIHYLEESARHLPELVRWLLLTEDGRSKLDSTRRAGYQRAKTVGSMRVALAPVLDAFERLLRL